MIKASKTKIRLVYVFVILIHIANCVDAIAAPVETILASANGVFASENYNLKEAVRNSERMNLLLKKHGYANNTIVLPKGKVWLATPIHISSYTHLTGHDAGSIIAFAKQVSNAEEGFIENENYYLGNYKMDSCITLSNFSIEGNGVTPQKGQARGVFFNKVKNVFIRNLKVFNTTMEGIRIDCSAPGAPSENVIIEGCRIERRGLILQNIMIRSYTEDAYNNTRIPSNVFNIIIRNNLTIGGQHGICVFNVKNALIYGNICHANSARGIIVSPTGENISIVNNKVDSAGSTGIHMAFYAKNIVVDSNIVSNTIADMSGIGQEGQGIKAYAGFTNMTFTNNTCTNNATDGIALEGGGMGTGFWISGNTCSGNKRNGVRIWGGEINQKKSGDIFSGTIEKNTLQYNKEDEINIGSDNKGQGVVKNLTISGNRINASFGKKKYQLQYTNKSVIISD